MLPILASSGAQATLFEPMMKIFNKADTLAHPKELLDALAAMGVVWSVVFFIAGLVTMLNGYKYYKAVTVSLALLLGLFAGYAMGEHLQAPGYIVAGCLGVLLAVLCFPLMKYAVAVLGGLVGAFLGANMWTAIVHVVYQGNAQAIENGARFHTIGALIGLLVCGLLAFILFKFAVVLFTSVSGSTLFILGGLSLLMQVRGVRESVVGAISQHPVVIPMLVLVPAVIGLILQESQPANAPAGVAAKKPDAKPAAA